MLALLHGTVAALKEALLTTSVYTALYYAAVTTGVLAASTYFCSACLFAPVIRFKGAHVVVTGGSAGIGLSVAKEYVVLGADVTIVARNPKVLADAAEELAYLAKNVGSKSTIRTVSVDVGSSENFVRMAFVNQLIPDCDILVNCAGTSIAAPFEELGSDDFERMLRVNVLGSIYPTRVLLPGMKRRGGGRIVFVSSQVAQCALHGYTAYAASKWAVRGLAEALSMEVRPFGIYVSVAYPPDTDTPGYKNEMLTKPSLTATLSSAGTVFKPALVARDIANYSSLGYFGITTGFDGWLLKQLHPGMTPVHNAWEVLCQVLFCPIARIISVFYVAWFYHVVAADKNREENDPGPWRDSAPSVVSPSSNSEGVQEPVTPHAALSKRAPISKDR